MIVCAKHIIGSEVNLTVAIISCRKCTGNVWGGGRIMESDWDYDRQLEKYYMIKRDISMSCVFAAVNKAAFVPQSLPCSLCLP